MKWSLPLTLLVLLTACASKDLHQEDCSLFPQRNTFSRMPAGVDEAARVGDTTISQAPAAPMIVGPNGAIVIPSSSYQEIRGTWDDGVHVDITRVLTGTYIPERVLIDNFELEVRDGKKMNVLALTAEENKLGPEEKSKILHRRAQFVCDQMKSHRHVLEVTTSSKWFGGWLVDVSDREKDGESFRLATSEASAFSGAKYFSQIVCSSKPRGS